MVPGCTFDAGHFVVDIEVPRRIGIDDRIFAVLRQQSVLTADLY